MTDRASPGDSFSDPFSAALAAFQRGQIDEAIAGWRTVIEQSPNHFNALQLLGLACHRRGRWAEAEAYLRRAIGLKSTVPELWFNLAKVYEAQGRWPEAEQCDRSGLRLRPDDVSGLDHWGVCLRSLDRLEEAAAAHLRCQALKPEWPIADDHLGVVRAREGRVTEAVECFQRAIAKDPTLSESHTNLGGALRDAGRFAEAREAYRAALDARPDLPLAWMGLLFTALHEPDFPQSERFRLHREWIRHLARDSSILPPAPPRRAGRLRIGYVSSDLIRHSVAYFVAPILVYHDRARFEISVFANIRQADAMTEFLRPHAEHWHDIYGKPAAEVAALVRRSEIDILIDLNGHSGKVNLGIFARKPAPVQVTYLGYPDTTGMPEIDYRLTDELADPPGDQDAFHTEKLWRLPSPAWCYAPGAGLPAFAARPGPRPIVFGCFGSTTKLNSPLLGWWAEILRQVPDARLKLKGAAFADPAYRARVLDQFESAGVAASRLDLLAWIPQTQSHLEAYLDVDIVLDTYPYCGTTTTCEALWMGAPVVTLVGKEHRSRVGLSLLTAVGLPDCATTSPAAYMAKAIALARDRGRLDAIKVGLRERMSRSPLMDGPRFAGHLEHAYEEMMARHAATPAKSGA